MPTIEINDTTLYYERAGHGPAMLFVHGMCGDADVWVDQAERFSDRYTCVRYDRRGHSRSACGDATITDAVHADDAAALIEALDLAPCLLVGSSGGAAISVEVALRHGHLLRGAVFSEPPLFSLDPAAGRAFVGELMPRVEEATATGGPRAAVDAFFSFVCPGLWSIIDEERKDRYRDNADIGFTDVRSQSLEATAEDLGALAVPSLVVAGSESHPSFQSIAHQLAASIPDARFVQLEGSGHVTYAERPDEFAHAVSVFASELDRRAPLASAKDASDRFDVRSADGTSLAVWVDGIGPPLVVVHGSLADHTTFDAFVDELQHGVTVYAMDRRGFGASGDAQGYTIEREFEDVAAVVDAVAARTGGRVALWGHSYGANCAMGAATLTINVSHLVLYEPSLGLPYPDGAIEAVEKALAAGDREAAILSVLVETLDMPEEDVNALRSGPRWSVFLAGAPTVPRECRAERGWVYRPGQFDAIAAPTLLLAGSESPADLSKATSRAADAISDVRIRVLEGQGHLAHKTDPGMVAAITLEFVGSRESARS